MNRERNHSPLRVYLGWDGWGAYPPGAQSGLPPLRLPNNKIGYFSTERFKLLTIPWGIVLLADLYKIKSGLPEQVVRFLKNNVI